MVFMNAGKYKRFRVYSYQVGCCAAITGALSSIVVRQAVVVARNDPSNGIAARGQSDGGGFFANVPSTVELIAWGVLLIGVIFATLGLMCRSKDNRGVDSDKQSGPP